MKSFKEFNPRTVKKSDDWYGILKIKKPVSAPEWGTPESTRKAKSVTPGQESS